jgi:hypothetical protein
MFLIPYQYIVYCAFLAFQLGYIFLFLVETKGKTLEETAAIFDGQQQIDSIANVGYAAVTESQEGYAFNSASSKTREAGEVEGGGGAEIALSLSRNNSMARTNPTERESDVQSKGTSADGSKKGLLWRLRRNPPDSPE